MIRLILHYEEYHQRNAYEAEISTKIIHVLAPATVANINANNMDIEIFE